MAHKYYNTKESVYSLIKNHPSTYALLADFGISDSSLMDVAEFLIANKDDLLNTPLNIYYEDSDLIDQLAEIYGFNNKPWGQYKTGGGVSLLELLQLTIYLYKFGTTDNFYEKNIFNFIPEYDREQILNTPKLKLSVEGLGRKLDQLEDQIIRFSELYDINTCPDEFLDYLGQNLGYEREDYTLSGVSFRELLKNIIEIYKIKGTNYSFSFFFKFLGFEIDLKEFYFNRDVKNPTAFPGMTELNVEYYLTTTNPMKETGDVSQGIILYPQTHLGQTRNIDEWKIELNSLTEYGCTNAIEYLRGKESYNNNGIKWHSNPWTYFKTNLIEYNLEPFMNKMNLTASDNETVKKYVKFLSPTYLFTWININLTPWIEDVHLIIDEDDSWIRKITKVLGDPRPTPSPWPMFAQGLPGIPTHNPTEPWERKDFPGPYRDYEDLLEITMFKSGGEVFKRIIDKQLNVDGSDQFGTTLRRNGEHTRQPDSPKFVTNAKHRRDKRLCFDSLDITLKDIADATFTSYSATPFPIIPHNTFPKAGQMLTASNNIEIKWENIPHSSYYWVQIALNNIFVNTEEWKEKNLIADIKTTENNYEHIEKLSNDVYYWRIRTRNTLQTYYDEDMEDNWSNYIFTPAIDYNPSFYMHNTGWSPWSDISTFTIKTSPFPYDGEIINRATVYVTPLYQWNVTKTKQFFVYASFTMTWPSSLRTEHYEVEFITENSSSIIRATGNFLSKNFSNGSYQWRYRAKDIDGVYSEWSDILNFTINFSDSI